ncbi:MAG: molybdopterin-dependent oxidoreductase [Actinobacteria bacterium]|nr:molybdopterin-dependent oxidoreductase [Actinomycetota bacterium]
MTTDAPSRLEGAAAGLVSGALAVGVGMLVAAITDVVSPIDAVGSEVIDRAPLWLKELAIRWFGTDDKLALRIGIITLLAVAAAALGMAARRRAWIGWTGFGVFGLIGALAAAHRPGESVGAAVPSVLGALVGGWVLQRALRPRPIEVPGPSQVPLGWDRRRFLVTGGATAVAAAAAAGVATALEGKRVDDLREAAAAPLPSASPTGLVNEIPSGATVDPSIPFITPTGDFYRIDTALSFPRVDLKKWRVDIKGMVDTPLSFSYDELLAMPQEERVVTLCCVSNEVGGEYVGNAVWQGVMLRDVLDRAGVQPGAEQVFSTSLDGWTCGFPVEAALDGRDAMLVVGMNGSTLPLEHGYPVRLVVPGLYGYVSATKWLEKIELTTWDRQGYWVPRGWSRLGPIKTQSRIDVPRANAKVAAGPQKIAGVAWAQHTGILSVEVRVDDGEWQQARLATDVSDDAWRQWVLDWDAPAGEHRITVRATDKTGATQTEDRAPVAPDGATGWHAIRVKVS